MRTRFPKKIKTIHLQTSIQFRLPKHIHATALRELVPSYKIRFRPAHRDEVACTADGWALGSEPLQILFSLKRNMAYPELWAGDPCRCPPTSSTARIGRHGRQTLGLTVDGGVDGIAHVREVSLLRARDIQSCPTAVRVHWVLRDLKFHRTYTNRSDLICSPPLHSLGISEDEITNLGTSVHCYISIWPNM